MFNQYEDLSRLSMSVHTNYVGDILIRFVSQNSEDGICRSFVVDRFRAAALVALIQDELSKDFDPS